MTDSEKEFEELKGYISKHGFECKYYRDPYLNRRLSLRFHACGVKTCGEYLEFLKKNTPEFQNLVDCLAINVTSFFRDSAPFEILGNEIFPNLVNEKKNSGIKTILVWSAACSTGEEPYSIAITAFEHIHTYISGKIELRIIATDIDDYALRKAAEGRYSPKSLDELDEKIKRRYFKKDGKEYAVSKSIKDLVTFKKLDLILNEPVDCADIVICRNMLIYINHDLQEAIFDKFYRALNMGGYLILGKTEALPARICNKFITINSDERIFKKGA